MILTQRFNVTRARIFPCAWLRQATALPSPKTRQFGVFLFPRWSLCLQRVIPADILIPHVVSLCETHTLVPTLAVYDLDVTSGLWWGWWTLVDACIVEWTSSWSSCNTDKEENPQPLHDFISDKKSKKIEKTSKKHQKSKKKASKGYPLSPPPRSLPPPLPTPETAPNFSFKKDVLQDNRAAIEVIFFF